MYDYVIIGMIVLLLTFGFGFMFLVVVALCYQDKVTNGINSKNSYSKLVNEVANGVYKAKEADNDF